ncbi:TetR/AcrR family transcriptional regulator [Brachybacterium tyrofermentans]|uniref:TetR family transcriptional regulator n=1 Tax=Brachybacterium tyrofermentans TaxID=47848 RepID=A0ABW0FNS1_9MICO|nr:TetR family transcriptional regulator [Brachybacterium tyrofermentans]SLN04857.1 Transcriptional regulator, TetR family [Corynebacterium xerosis]
MDHPPPSDERILSAALRRFAVDGLSASLRRVAEDAEVSAGLIIHHYGSRGALLEACDRRALEVTRREKSSLFAGGSAELFAQLAQTTRYAPVVGYVLRRLQAGGPLAVELVGDFAADAVEYFADGERAGTITPSRDPQARAQVLTEMALGALLLQLPAQRDQLDLEELPAWFEQYSARIIGPILELYSIPLLADRSMLDAYLAATQGDDPAPQTIRPPAGETS